MISKMLFQSVILERENQILGKEYKETVDCKYQRSSHVVLSWSQRPAQRRISQDAFAFNVNYPLLSLKVFV